MLKLGTETGSFTNFVLSAGDGPIPVVGMGATILGWTDRHACTIIEVSKSGKTIKIQQDTAIRTDKNGMSDCQSYDYSPDPDGCIREVRLTKKGWKITGGGSSVRIGDRDEHYDYSF